MRGSQFTVELQEIALARDGGKRKVPPALRAVRDDRASEAEVAVAVQKKKSNRTQEKREEYGDSSSECGACSGGGEVGRCGGVVAVSEGDGGRVGAVYAVFGGVGAVACSVGEGAGIFAGEGERVQAVEL